MGCDIHGIIEVKSDIGWTRLENYPFPSERNYDVFAILGNVRNGSGFAGVKTGKGFNFISDCRGFPEDSTIKHPEMYLEETGSYDDLTENDEPWMGDHSFSYITLKELVDFDWLQTTVHTGILSIKEWCAYNSRRSLDWMDEEEKQPQSYSGGVWGNGIEIISDDEAKEKYSHLSPYPEGQGKDEVYPEKIYVRCYWTSKYITSARFFLIKLWPLLKYGPENVRLVFGFDS